MKIGVVTATHPARNLTFLPRAVKSVWQQDLPAAGHFIACDNDRRGVSPTRQDALMANPYPLTAFLDSDDWFLPCHLQVLYDAMMATGADYVYSWYHIATGRVGQEATTDVDSVFPPSHFLDPWDPLQPRHTTITVLVRTELAKEVGFVDVANDGNIGARRGEDWYFTLECNRLGKIHHVVERTWFWHHHGGNSSGIAGYGDAA